MSLSQSLVFTSLLACGDGTMEDQTPKPVDVEISDVKVKIDDPTRESWSERVRRGFNVLQC